MFALACVSLFQAAFATPNADAEPAPEVTCVFRYKLNAFVEALSSITILEVVRSGLIGISRGEKSLG